MLRAAGAAAARRWRLELFRARRYGMLECVEYVVGDVCQYVVAGVVGLTKRHANRHAKRHAAVVGAVCGGGRRGRGGRAGGAEFA